jgi:hypothetical protein
VSVDPVTITSGYSVYSRYFLREEGSETSYLSLALVFCFSFSYFWGLAYDDSDSTFVGGSFGSSYS